MEARALNDSTARGYRSRPTKSKDDVRGHEIVREVLMDGDTSRVRRVAAELALDVKAILNLTPPCVFHSYH